MAFLFGSKKTPKEMMREYKRGIDRAIRDLDKERMQLQKQEKQVVADIKKMAKQGQMGAAQIMAKDLVRTRKYITKFYKMKTQLQAVSLKLQTMQSTQAMTDAMKGATKAMKAMNKQMNLPNMNKIMKEFEKQNAVMEGKEEMMGDAIDDVMGDEDDEAETQEIVNAVMEEIGIDLTNQLAEAPSSQIAAPQAAPAKPQAVPAGGDDDDLQARLENLKK